jgi:hypothetical protein
MNEAEKIAPEMPIEKRFEKLWLIVMGNGVKGIVGRTDDLEDQMQKVIEHHIEEPQILQKAVEDALKKFYQGMPALIQSFGPWVAAAAAVLVAILK